MGEVAEDAHDSGGCGGGGPGSSPRRRPRPWTSARWSTSRPGARFRRAFPLAARPNPAWQFPGTGLSTSPSGCGLGWSRGPRGGDGVASVAVSLDGYLRGVEQVHAVGGEAPPVVGGGAVGADDPSPVPAPVASAEPLPHSVRQVVFQLTESDLGCAVAEVGGPAPQGLSHEDEGPAGVCVRCLSSGQHLDLGLDRFHCSVAGIGVDQAAAGALLGVALDASRRWRAPVPFLGPSPPPKP